MKAVLLCFQVLLSSSRTTVLSNTTCRMSRSIVDNQALQPDRDGPPHSVTINMAIIWANLGLVFYRPVTVMNMLALLRSTRSSHLEIVNATSEYCPVLS